MNDRAGLVVLYKKELADHIRSKRFLIIVVLITIVGIASIYSAASGIQKAVEQEGNEFVFLRLFSSSGGSLPSFISFISFLGPLIGLSLGFDGINGEMARGTMSRLLAQPIHRDAVINGKFLAGVSVLSIMTFSLGTAVGAIGIIITGVPPSGEELARILIFLIFTVIYMSLWLAVSLLFSLIFKQTATSALAGIALWLIFAIFIGLLAGLVADAMFPVNQNADAIMSMKNQRTRQFINRISPVMIYNEVVITLLNPGVRVLGPIFSEQLDMAISGALPLGQSLLLIWPHLVTLIAATLICFSISYVIFMREEIRAV
ncbi:MAG: ABC transporter permease subunit [Clostridia bacterium]|nr:ABC transporter permease subunit [Clostridia bacterium]